MARKNLIGPFVSDELVSRSAPFVRIVVPVTVVHEASGVERFVLVRNPIRGARVGVIHEPSAPRVRSAAELPVFNPNSEIGRAEIGRAHD